MGYDGLARLRTVTRSGVNEAYDYDDTGNIRTKTYAGTSTTYNYDAVNKLRSLSDGMNLDYDPRGNVTAVGATNMGFDGHSQLRMMATPAKYLEFEYDGLHRRAVSRRDKNETVSFYTRDGALVAEYDRRTGESRDYVHVAHRPFAMVSCLRSDADSDGDGIPNCFEIRWGLSPSSAADAAGDLDQDGVSNLAEYQAGTSALSADSDGDGMPDAFEIRHKLDPLWDDSLEDKDHDGVSNFAEYQRGTSPSFNPAWLGPILDLILN